MKLSPERLRAISHNIKQTRLERGLTQEKVAELAGITTVYYCQIELGNKSPSLETIINIADAMQVSIDTLVHGANRQTMMLDLIRLFEKCDERDIAKLRKVLYTVADEFVLDHS